IWAFPLPPQVRQSAHVHDQYGTGCRYLPNHLCSDDAPERYPAADWWSVHDRTRQNRPPAAGRYPLAFVDPSDEHAIHALPPAVLHAWSSPPNNFLALFSARDAGQREGNRGCDSILSFFLPLIICKSYGF